jgi:hypothetical protein
LYGGILLFEQVFTALRIAHLLSHPIRANPKPNVELMTSLGGDDPASGKSRGEPTQNFSMSD